MLEVADACADAERGASAVFNFEVSQVQFGFTSREKSNAGAVLCESDSEALAYAAARPGDQDSFVLDLDQSLPLTLYNYKRVELISWKFGRPLRRPAPHERRIFAP
jgi:hypothetical protein